MTDSQRAALDTYHAAVADAATLDHPQDRKDREAAAADAYVGHLNALAIKDYCEDTRRLVAAQDARIADLMRSTQNVQSQLAVALDQVAMLRALVYGSGPTEPAGG